MTAWGTGIVPGSEALLSSNSDWSAKKELKVSALSLLSEYMKPSFSNGGISDVRVGFINVFRVYTNL